MVPTGVGVVRFGGGVGGVSTPTSGDAFDRQTDHSVSGYSHPPLDGFVGGAELLTPASRQSESNESEDFLRLVFGEAVQQNRDSTAWANECEKKMK